MGIYRRRSNRHPSAFALEAAIVVSAVLAGAFPAVAQNATWLNTATVETSPGSGLFDFNAGANWTPATVPTGTAFFGATTTPGIAFSAGTSIGGLTFNAGAPAYAILNTQSIAFTGAGVINGGGLTYIQTGGSTRFDNASSAGGGFYSIDSGSNIRFTGSSTASGATIDVVNGALRFTADSTAQGAIIRNRALGATSLDDESTAAGASFQNDSGGQLRFFSRGTAANATIQNDVGGIVSFNQFSTAANAAITNAGQINFNNASTLGSATLNMSASNTGFVQFNNTSSAGTAAATVNNNGQINFNDTSTAGSAAFTNTNRLYFLNDCRAGNASITSSNDLQFRDNSTAGNATIFNTFILAFAETATAGNANITNNGTAFNFDNSSTAGSANITNNGSVSFNNTSSAGNANINNNGSLSFGNSSTAGSATITNNGGLFFNNSSTAENATITTTSGATTLFADSVSGGNARMIIQSGGAVDIGNLTNGGTTFGSIEGAGDLRLEGNNGTVGSNNLSTTFSGTVFGNGSSLAKVGTGTLSLDGINAYTGATTVNGGTLAVNGSTVTSSLTTVNAGGILGGTGIVGNTTIGGGTLAPGNSIGTITIQGNLVLTSAAIYMVEVSGTTSDKTVVTGTAALGGTVSVKPLTRVAATTIYTILTSNGLTGTFAGVTVTNPALARAKLSYSGNDVLLTLDPGILSAGLSSNANGNQRAVAGAIDTALLSGANLPSGFNALFSLTGDALLNGLTQVSGQGAAATQTATFDAMGQFVNMIIDPNNAGRDAGSVGGGATGYAPDDAMAYARKAKEKTPFARVFTKAPVMADAPRWSVWAAGFGGSQTTDGVAAVGSNTTNSSIYGAAAGADYRLSPNTIAGFALAGGGINFRTANLGSGRSDLFQAGAFVRHNVGNAYVTAAAAYGWQDVTTDRTVTIAGIDRLRANFNTNTLTGRVEGGYRFVAPTFGGVGLTPYAAGQVTTVFLPGYAEAVLSGANTFALAYASRDVTATRSELGLRADKSFVMDTAILTLRGRAAWAHNFDPDRSVNATFQSLPGASFTVNGASASRNTALTTASAEWRWFNNWSIAATFEGEFSDRTRSYAGKGLVRYVW